MDVPIVIIAFTIIIAIPIIMIIRGVLDYYTRKQLKEISPPSDESDENLRQSQKYMIYSNFKWAFICIGVGLPLIIIDVFPDMFSRAGILGLLFVGAGLGFLAYFFIINRTFNNQSHNKNNGVD